MNFVKTLRRSGLTELAATLATAKHYNGKRPFPIHHFGTQNRSFPSNALAIPKTSANQPAPQTAKPLPLPNRLPVNVCASLAGQGRCTNGRSPFQNLCHAKRPFPNQRAHVPQNPTNQPAPQPSKLLPFPTHLTENVCANPAGQPPNKTGLCLPTPAPQRKR